MLAANRDFVRHYPVTTKRAMRAREPNSLCREPLPSTEEYEIALGAARAAHSTSTTCACPWQLNSRVECSVTDRPEHASLEPPVSRLVARPLFVTVNGSYGSNLAIMRVSLSTTDRSVQHRGACK